MSKLANIARWTAPALLLAAVPAHAALTVGYGATTGVSCRAGVCTATTQNATLGIKRLEGLLAAGDLTLAAGTQANDIAVEAPFSWTAGHGLTLDARHSIRIDRTIDAAGPGALTLTTNDGLQGGTLSFGGKGSVHFWSTGNGLTINGAAYALVDSLAALASAVAVSPSGRYALATGYDAASDGTYAAPPVATTFTGTFEGLGNAISNLRVDATGGHAGLFDWIGDGGRVANLTLKSANVKSSAHRFAEAGALTAINYGTIENVTVHAVVSAGRFADIGGLAGAGGHSSVIVGSSVQGLVRSGYGGFIGGLIGDATDSSANTIANSYSTATVTGADDTHAGGLAGLYAGVVSKSWSSGAVSVKDEKNSAPMASAGGLVGYLASFGGDGSTIENCYASGAVGAGAGAAAGGLIGIYNDDAPANGLIVSSYSFGTVAAGASGFAGGLIGYRWAEIVARNTYWDTTTSGITDLSKGVGNTANVAGIAGLTTTQLQSGLPAGFSAAVWAENPHYLNGLPFLIADLPG
jgi:hypothetical protein